MLSAQASRHPQVFALSCSQYPSMELGYMPTVLRVGRFRFYFFSNESQEPPHIHIQAAGDQAKFWLEPIRLAVNFGFAARDLNEIERIIREHQAELVEAWNEYFS